MVVYLNFYLNVKQPFSVDATIFLKHLIKTYFEKKNLKEKLKLIIFPYCPELPKQKNLFFGL